jgi:nitrous oxidase accessory protein
MTTRAILLGVLLLQAAELEGGTLQARIRGAAPGDTIVLHGGVYEENVLIDRRIVLIGVDGPVISGTGRGSAVTVTADSCTIAGLRVERSGRMLVNEDAGILLRSSHNRVEGNTLRDVLFGVYLLRSTGNTIARNDIAGRAELTLGERGSGIHIYDSPRNSLTDNVITDVRDGLYIQNANNTHIEGNRITRVRYGLHYMYADSNVFLRNSFTDNIAGAAIMFTRGIVMRHNVFSRNRSFSAFGVLLQDCHGLVADSNIITDNVVGLFLENSTGNMFRHNVVARNDLALQMFQNAVGNTFTGNLFVDNLNPLTIVGRTTGSSWSAGGRGNYWSSYDGYDLDGDGLGDVPMKIQNVFQYLEGRIPTLRLFLYSPASQALAAASTAFPVLDLSREEDRGPIMRPYDISGFPAAGLAGAAPPPPSGATAAALAAPAGAVALAVLLARLRRRRP